MKKLFTLSAIFVMLCAVGCSDIDTENPIINMPSSGNTNNDGEDSSKKVSIVGTWKAKYIANSYSHTFKVTFNSNNSGVWLYTFPTWVDDKKLTCETHRSDFTYMFDMNHALLKVTNICYDKYMDTVTEELTAFITSHNGEDVLHFHSLWANPTTFTRIN